MTKILDLTGDTYGQLTVLRPAPEKGRWVVKCTCGNTAVVKGSSMRSGNTKSCGCMVRTNPGRPVKKHPPFIPFGIFLEGALMSLVPLREFLKSRGVLVTGNSQKGYYTVNNIKYGPYDSVLQALMEAMRATVIGLEPTAPVPSRMLPPEERPIDLRPYREGDPHDSRNIHANINI